MAAAYTTAGAVEASLGRQLSQEQVTQATALIAAAQAYIDLKTNRTWSSDPITNEQYDVTDRMIYLRTAPVASVQQVRWRTRLIGDTPQALQPTIDYELQDGARGLLIVGTGYTRGNRDALPSPSDWTGPSAYTDLTWGTGTHGSAPFILVDYTPSVVPSGEIVHACTMLVAHWLTYSIDPDRYGLRQYKLGDEIEVQVDDATRQRVIPAEILDILAGNRLPIIA